MEGLILQLAATLHVHSTQLCLFYNVWFGLDGFINTQNYRVYEGCLKSLASYFFKNQKMMLERYSAVVI